MFCKAEYGRRGQTPRTARERRRSLACAAAGVCAMIAGAAATPAAASPAAQPEAQVLRGFFAWDGALVASRGGAPAGTYDNLFRGGVMADGPVLGLSTDWQFDATFACTQNGRSISDEVRDVQGVINLDAGSRCRPYTLSAARDLGGLGARLGLIPADQYFDVADSCGVMLNSSFGVEPTWSRNTIAPIYPTAGVGVMVTWRRGAWIDRAGLFQADPNRLDSAFHEGALFIDEVVYHDATARGGTYKIGLWGYRPHGSTPGSLPPANWGLYLITEQPLVRGDASGGTAFVRLGLSPDAASEVPLDLQAGVAVPAPLPGRPDDQLSLGVAVAELHGGRTETAFEATYVLAVSGYVWLQPDLQYVLHPGGIHRPATVLALRLHLEFE